MKTITVGLGRFGFFNFGSVFNLEYSVLVFSVSVFVGMYRISGSGSGWPDIRPFFAIWFQF